MLQRLFGSAGGIDAEPVEPAEIVRFLPFDHGRVGIAGVAAARADALAPGRQVGGQEQAAKRYTENRRRLFDGDTFRRRGKHRIDDRRMAGRDGAAGLSMMPAETRRLIAGV